MSILLQLYRRASCGIWIDMATQQLTRVLSLNLLLGYTIAL
ncbi:hypothetical protein ACKFKF_28740 [Phormidesmis sp. 146-12]